MFKFLSDPNKARLAYMISIAFVWLVVSFDVVLTLGGMFEFLNWSAPEFLQKLNLTPALICLVVFFLGVNFIGVSNTKKRADEGQGNERNTFRESVFEILLHGSAISTLMIVLFIPQTNIVDVVFMSVSMFFGFITGWLVYNLLNMEGQFTKRDLLIMLGIILVFLAVYIWPVRQSVMNYETRTLLLDLSLYFVGNTISMGFLFFFEQKGQLVSRVEEGA